MEASRKTDTPEWFANAYLSWYFMIYVTMRISAICCPMFLIMINDIV